MIDRRKSNILLVSHDRPVSIRPAVAEKLPCVADLADLVHIEIGDDEFVLVTRALGDDLAARVAEIALAVKFADVPRGLGADAVDRTDKIAVRDGVCRLFEFPEIFGKSGDGRRRVKDYLGAVQAQTSCPSGKCRS